MVGRNRNRVDLLLGPGGFDPVGPYPLRSTKPSGILQHLT